MANNPTVSWTKSLTGTPTQYTVKWTVNGSVVGSPVVPVTAAQDASGYTLDFASSVPGVTLNPGDQISVTVKADDVPNNLHSEEVASTPPTVTIPTAPVPPGPPQGVTLALL